MFITVMLSAASQKNTKVTGDVQGIDKGGVYSHFAVAGNLVFVSGVSGQEKDRDTIFTEQLDKTLVKLKRILDEAGSSISGIVKLTVYLSDRSYFNDLNDIFEKYFPAKPPTRTTIVCSFVVPRIKVEIDAIAVKLPDKKAA